jgi:hypothetical protein
VAQKAAEPQQHEKRRQSRSGTTKGGRVALPTTTLPTKASFRKKETNGNAAVMHHFKKRGRNQELTAAKLVY